MEGERFLPRAQLQSLLDALRADQRTLFGPTVRDGAIVYAPLHEVSQLPRGVHDHQSPGAYRLEQDDSPRLFAWANGPQALKPLTFVAEEPLWQSTHDLSGLSFSRCVPAVKPLAVLGVRACDLAALRLQDQHFMLHIEDRYYSVRRTQLFLVVVHCSHPADTCFCASTGDGPACASGYDLALHELDEGFLVQAGSEAGEALAGTLPLQAASADQLELMRREQQAAVSVQTRSLPGPGQAQQLFAQLQHPRWQQLGERCLSCGNCTAVCPTCFCHREMDQPVLDAGTSVHIRQWDSCFSEGHSLLHGHPVRADTTQRYRQWLTHKLGGWVEQYGRSGCVGCGRCIAWCPVGIDITEEARAIAGVPT